MLLDDEVYLSSNAPVTEFLMEISSLDGLIAIAQELAKPVFALDLQKDTTFRGNVADTYRVKINDVREAFETGAQKVIELTDKF